MLQPKWDGFRLLVDVDAGGCVRGWSRHATNLSPRLGTLLVPFNTMAPGTTSTARPVAIGERDGHPTEDFAAVTRAVFTGNPAATDRLSYIAFDILLGAKEYVSSTRPWHERDERLRDALPATNRIRMIASQPATHAAHDAIIALGFEGTVLKRPNLTIRAGRHNSWLKHKAKLATNGEVLSVAQDRNGQWHALGDVGDRRVRALTGPRTLELVGRHVELAYSRIDANGGLREARLIPPSH